MAQPDGLAAAQQPVSLEKQFPRRQCLIPTIACADAARVFEESLLFFEPRETREFLKGRMVLREEGLLPVQNRWILVGAIVARLYAERLEVNRQRRSERRMGSVSKSG